MTVCLFCHAIVPQVVTSIKEYLQTLNGFKRIVLLSSVSLGWVVVVCG